MKDIKVRKSALLDTLAENLKVHEADFANAHSAWVERCIQLHEDRATSLRRGDFAIKSSDRMEPTEPESHAACYRRAIEMLGMSVESEVVIDEKTFRQYVQDEWDWGNAFKQTVTGYTGKLFE